MRVISDTSPVCHAVLIGEEALLPALFGKILVPPSVAEELAHQSAPEPVRTWIADPPDWLEVRAARPQEIPAALHRLHRGEREALLLARQLDIYKGWFVDK